MSAFSATVLDRKGTAAETARNAVLEQQRRLAAEFESTNSEPATSPQATGPFARMLCEVLASVGWEGKQHRIFEALPHLGPILSVRMLRAVLARLDVSLDPDRPARGRSDRGRTFPAFLSRARTTATSSRSGRGASSKSMT